MTTRKTVRRMVTAPVIFSGMKVSPKTWYRVDLNRRKGDMVSVPVAVVSLTPESIEALVEKAARAIGENSGYGTKAIELEMAKTDPEDQGNIWRDYARAALTAILGKTGRGK